MGYREEEDGKRKIGESHDFRRYTIFHIKIKNNYYVFFFLNFDPLLLIIGRKITSELANR